MKGYVVPAGYMGWMGQCYMLFSSEDEYVEMYKESYE